MMSPGVLRRPPIARPGLLWVGVVVVAQGLAIWLELGPPVQPILPIVFALTVPGFVLIDLEHPSDRFARFILAVAGSLATNIVLVTVLLLGSPVWMIPTGAVAAVGLWVFAVRRQQVADRPGVDHVAGDAGASAGDSTSGAEPAEEIYYPPVKPADLGVSWKRREGLGLDERPKRPFEKPVKPTEELHEHRVHEVRPPHPDPPTVEEPAAIIDAPGVAAWRRANAQSVVDDSAPPRAPVASGPLEQIVTWHEEPPSAGDDPSHLDSIEASRDLVNLNSADADLLATLPGVGPRLAMRLVEHREQHGPFAELADLERVSGFGPVKVSGLEGHVEFGALPPRESSGNEHHE